MRGAGAFALLLALSSISRPTAAQGAGVAVRADVVVHADPGSYQIVGVELPASARGGPSVPWRARLAGRVKLLGPTSGLVAGARGSVLLTLVIPADHPPGRVRATEIEFGTEDAPTGRRVIDVEVSAISRLDVTAASSTVGARAGEIAAARFRIWNRGNAMDTVRLVARLPAGWRLERQLAPIALEPGALEELVVRTRVAANAGAGSFAVRLEASATGGATAMSVATLRVVGAVGAGREVDRPTLTLGAAAGRGPGRERATGYEASLRGRIAGDLRVDASVPLGPRDTHADRALANAGYWRSPARATFSAESWRATLGPTYARFSDVAGADLVGRGISLDLIDTTWQLTTLGARPYSLGDAGGTLNAFAAARSFGTLRLGAEGAHLEERGTFHRDLDVAGATWVLRLPPSTALSGDIVERRYLGGRGLGGRLSYGWRARESALTAYAYRAPGGTNAFARATTELAAAGYRPLSARLVIGGSALLTHDSTPSWRSIGSRSLALAPSYRLTRDVTLLLEGSDFRYSAAGDAGSTDTRESRLTAGASAQHGFAYGTLSAAERRVSRATTMRDGSRSSAAAPREEYRGTVGVRGTVGDAQLFATLQRGRALSGFSGQYSTYGLRLDRIALWPGRNVLLGSAFAGFAQVADRPPIPSIRLGLHAAIARSTRLALAAERDPYAGLGRSKSWLLGVTLQHDIGLPQLPDGPGGAIFHDENNNGRRDPGEAGVQGVILRNLDMTTVTDARGHYRFDHRTNGPVRLDPASIPGDLVTPPSLKQDSLRRTIGLIRMAAVHVELVVEGDAASRVDSLDLASVLVTARDSAGHEWSGRNVAPGRVDLDALPPGRYWLTVDGSRSVEPLAVPDPLPFDVVDGAAESRLRVALRTRALRIRSFSNPPPAVRP